MSSHSAANTSLLTTGTTACTHNGHWQLCLSINHLVMITAVMAQLYAVCFWRMLTGAQTTTHHRQTDRRTLNEDPSLSDVCTFIVHVLHRLYWSSSQLEHTFEWCCDTHLISQWHLRSSSSSWREAFRRSLPPLRSFARTVGPPIAAGPRSLRYWILFHKLAAYCGHSRPFYW